MPFDVARVQSEIKAGLKNDRRRLDCARRSMDFYRGDFERYPVKPPGDTYDAYRYQRTSLLLRRVAHVLSAQLYKEAPARTLPDHPEAQAWLEAVYRRCGADALWQAADRLGCVTDVVAFQVEGVEDPDCPVALTLWDASQLCAWVDDARPTLVRAVATIDVTDERRRLRLWTDTDLIEYRTEKLGPGQTTGGTAYKEYERGPNPYGVLPFAFAHFDWPAQDFWSGGIGEHLANVNDWANFFLTENSDCIRYNLRPLLVARNVRAGWRPPRIFPGAVMDLADARNAGGEGSDPELSYLIADSTFIKAGWDDAQAYLDHVLEMVGVPPASVRLNASATSGIQILAEAAPLTAWAKGRQRAFARYEADLARVVLKVGAAHLQNNAAADPDLSATAAQLDAAAADPNPISLKFGDPNPDLPPGPEQQAQDQADLDLGLTSEVEILMRRRNLSREEAEKALEQIAEDRAMKRELFGEPDPSTSAGIDPRTGQPFGLAEGAAATTPTDQTTNPDEPPAE